MSTTVSMTPAAPGWNVALAERGTGRTGTVPLVGWVAVGLDGDVEVLPVWLCPWCHKTHTPAMLGARGAHPGALARVLPPGEKIDERVLRAAADRKARAR